MEARRRRDFREELKRMGFRKRYLPEHERPLLIRRQDPFAGRALAEEKLPGQPGIGELKSRSISELRRAGFNGEFEASLRVQAIRNVTIEISVTLLDSRGEELSVCTWKAGEGVSFRMLKSLN